MHIAFASYGYHYTDFEQYAIDSSYKRGKIHFQFMELCTRSIHFPLTRPYTLLIQFCDSLQLVPFMQSSATQSALFTSNLFFQNPASGLDEIRLRPPKGQRRRIPQLEGFVEIYHDKKWTKICSPDWSEKVASVICGQLGFPKAMKIPHLDTYL